MDPGAYYVKNVLKNVSAPSDNDILYPAGFLYSKDNHSKVVFFNNFWLIYHCRFCLHDIGIDPNTFDSKGCELYFFNKRDRKFFTDEWKKYKKKYFNGQEPDSTLPLIYNQTYINGYAIKIDKSLGPVVQMNEVEREAVPQWLWILENCQGPALYSYNCWIFKNKRDAILYRLTWA